jgi:hypothetical protein
MKRTRLIMLFCHLMNILQNQSNVFVLSTHNHLTHKIIPATERREECLLSDCSGVEEKFPEPHSCC